MFIKNIPLAKHSSNSKSNDWFLKPPCKVTQKGLATLTKGPEHKPLLFNN